jgi:alpha-amylase
MKISHVITGLTWTSGLIGPISALSPAEWRGQSIYQVITDRFARTDGSTTAACDPGMGQYCGGTWQGIISHLDYIQNMGFTAVSFYPRMTYMRFDAWVILRRLTPCQ